MSIGDKPPVEHPQRPASSGDDWAFTSLDERLFGDNEAQRASAQRHIRRRAVRMVGGIVVVGAATAGGLLVAPNVAGWLSSHLTPPVTAPAAEALAGPVRISRSVPPGWTADFGWSHEVSDGAVPLVSEDRVVFVNADGRLVVLDASSGEVLWGSADAGLSQNAAKYVVEAGSEPVVVVRDGDLIYVWPLEADGTEVARQTVALPGAAVVSGSGGRLLVSSAEGTWVLSDGSTLESVPVGAQEAAMSATSAGGLISAGRSGGWSIRDMTSGDVSEVEPRRTPSGAVGSPYPAWSARSVVVVWWATGDRAVRAVGFYDASTGSLLAEGQMATELVNDGLHLSVSRDRSVASAGPLLANLSTGQTHVADGWSSTTLLSGTLFGTDAAGTKWVWRSTGAPERMPSDTAVPWGVSSSGRAVVIDRPEDGVTLLGGLEAAAGSPGGPGIPEDNDDADTTSTFAAAGIPTWWGR